MTDKQIIIDDYFRKIVDINGEIVDYEIKNSEVSKLVQKIEKLNSRNVDKAILNKLSQNINERNKLIQQLNKKQEERNQISSSIAKEKSAEIIAKASTIKNEVKERLNKLIKIYS